MTGPRLAYLLAFASLAFWTASHLLPPINLDVGALLYVAQRWVAGDRLYVGVIDPNTPWAIALHVPAVAFAKTFGGNAPSWFSGFVCALIALSVGLAARLLRYARPGGPSLTALTLPLAALLVLGPLPGSSFGQREHLLLIGALPYLLLAGLRAEGAAVPLALRLGVAVLAAGAFAIKPYFVAPLLLVEVYLLARRGWRATFGDVVPWVIGIAMVVHLLAAILLTPEYFSFVIPFTRATYEDPIGQLANAVPLLLGPDLLPVTLLLPMMSLLAFVWSGSRFAEALTLFVLGAVASALLQGKGWDYQSLPALGSTLLLAMLLTALVLDRWRAGEPVGPLASVLAIGLTLPAVLLVGFRTRPFRDQIDFVASGAGQWVSMLKALPGNKRILVLSDGMYPQFPAIVYSSYTMAMPFITLWPIAGVYQRCGLGEERYRSPEAQSAEEEFAARSIAEAFLRDKPSVLVVDRYPGIPSCAGAAFDYLAYFKRNDAFAAAFKTYRPLITLDGRYDFYLRG